MEQVLKRLPGANQETTGESNKSILNESCLQLLKENCGIGVTKQKRKIGSKITPGKKVISLETSEYSSKNKKGKATPSSAASCSRTKLVEDELENEDEIWVCGECNAEWEMDDNRWIVCDNCDTPFHLQCLGVFYDKSSYYEVDIENIQFLCDFCNQQSS